MGTTEIEAQEILEPIIPVQEQIIVRFPFLFIFPFLVFSIRLSFFRFLFRFFFSHSLFPLSFSFFFRFSLAFSIFSFPCSEIDFLV